MEPKQLGKYQLLKKVGQGSYGTVYKASDPMGRTVAIKVLLPGWGEHPETIERFILEARSAGELFHPHIATILDLDEEDGRRFLVMRYVHGPSLELVLNANHRLSWKDSLKIIAEVAEGLDYAHKHGFVHRDLKPSNILLGTEGAVISDFGLVKAAETSGLSASDAILGTPAYIAPEVWNGEAVTPATDIYSLACVFYEMLTGERLFQGDSAPQVMKRHIIDGPKFPNKWTNDIPEGIEAVLQRALSQEKQQRYSSGIDFVSALKALYLDAEDSIEEKQYIQEQSKVQTEPVAGPSTIFDKEVEQKIPIQMVERFDDREEYRGNLKKENRDFWDLFFIIIIGSGIVGFMVIMLILFGLVIWPIPTETILETNSTQLIENLNWTATTDAMITSVQVKRNSTATAIAIATKQITPDVSTSTTSLRTGKFVDDHGVEMAWIPAGSFMMGSEDGEDDEQPIHEVYLDTYAIDVYEVTNEKYAECVDAGACGKPGGSYYGNAQYDDHPVLYVDWNNARDYCEWRGGRLPTEAEWEKAARGGLEGKLYPWGDEAPTCQKGAKNGAQYNECDGGAVAVGSFTANGYGLYDMAGNVWEWVADWYDEDYYGISKYENPTGPTSGLYRALRGGCWGFTNSFLRTAYRRYHDPDFSYHNPGFRCVGSSTPGE